MTSTQVASPPAVGTSQVRHKALFVSKWPQRWNGLFLAKFQRLFDVETVHIHEEVRLRGYSAFVSTLNARIAATGAAVVLLDIEFYGGFGLDLIIDISPRAKVILVTFDDIAFHEMNYIHSRGCDLVLCADPVAVLKYREKNIPAVLCLLENSRVPYAECQGVEKDIDVLFFGDMSKGGRREFLRALTQQGVNVTVHAPEVDGELAYPALARLISRARLVLNLSHTHAVSGVLDSFVPVSSYLQFKGRVVEAGLARAVCVSEYAPSLEYLFGPELVPMFRSVDECARIMKALLADRPRLARLADALHTTVLERYEESVQLPEVRRCIDGITLQERVAPGWIPYRYVRATAIRRFLQIRPRPQAWLRDFYAFLTGPSVYPLRFRLVAAIALLPEMVKMLLSRGRRRHAQ